MSLATSKPVSKSAETLKTKNVEVTSESLLHRLAGPSVGKSGLAQDQKAITAVIAEASVGSKFFLNEQRKDEELTKKITALLEQRDQILPNSDIARVEASMDKVIAELEATRDLSQFIVHVDMDAFYASVELLDDSSLAGKAFGVGGGVLTTASYEARQFGVRSGMPEYIARKLCPHLIVVKNHFSRYSEMSKKVMNILARYDEDMDPASIDEAYLNVTEYCEVNSIGPEECVEHMRKTIFEETQLTASAGIAPNKMLAKICSDRNKPNGQFYLPFELEAVMAFTKVLPIRKIPGIGRVSERLLDSIGIKMCGDIYTYRATLALLDKHFHVREKLAIYLGLGSNVVKPWSREARKSVGSERTFHAISDPAEIIEKLEFVAKELEEDMERLSYAGHTITLKIKLDTFELRSRAKSTSKPVRKYDEILAIGKELLQNELPVTIRLIGLRITGLKDLTLPERGIKRFFGQVETAEEGSRKKRRLADGYDSREKEILLISEDEDEEVDSRIARLSQGKRSASVAPTSKPEDVDIKPRASSHEPPGSQEFEPVYGCSASGVTGSASAGVRIGIKPRSEPHRPNPNLKPKPPSTNAHSETQLTEQHVCPICSKTLQTDNAGLNAHIDFCLSRSAILAASASASTSSSTSTSTFAAMSKPTPEKKPQSSSKKFNTNATKPSSKKGTSKPTEPDIRKAWKFSS